MIIDKIMLKEFAVAAISPLYPILCVKTAETVDNGAQQAIINISFANKGKGNTKKTKLPITIIPRILNIKTLKT